MFFLTTQVFAQTPPRFPNDRITAKQWQQYFDEMKALPGAEVREIVPVHYTVIFKDSSAWFFTSPQHPAHPAAIKREAAEVDKQVVFLREGYYAGDEKAFAAWWEKFDEMDRAAKDRIEAEAARGRR